MVITLCLDHNEKVVDRCGTKSDSKCEQVTANKPVPAFMSALAGVPTRVGSAAGNSSSEEDES